MQEDDRLPTRLWLDAHIQQLTVSGTPYYIHNTGNHASGTVLLKINGLEHGCRVLQQQRNLDGEMGWMILFKGETVAEKEADDYIQRAVQRDPDLWAVEIEDRELKNPFDGNEF